MTEVVHQEDKQAGGDIHLWLWAALVFPFGTVLAGIGLIGGLRHPAKFVRHHAAQALNFGMLMAAIGVIAFPMAWAAALVAGAGGGPAAFLVFLVLGAAVFFAPWSMRSRARDGEWATYPAYLPIFRVDRRDVE